MVRCTIGDLICQCETREKCCPEDAKTPSSNSTACHVSLAFLLQLSSGGERDRFASRLELFVNVVPPARPGASILASEEKESKEPPWSWF